MKRTKIVCTIGPASGDYKTLKDLALAGMDVARLNFSHGTQKEKVEHIKLIRQISEELNKPIAIIGDLQGPKIRLGEIAGIRGIKKGERIRLSLNPIEDELPMQFDLSPFVKRSQRIFLNDGLVELKVTGLSGKTIETIAGNSGWVSSHKGVNIPDTHLKGASFTDKDATDAEFALKNGADYLSVSFIQTLEDLRTVKKLIKKFSSKAQVIVKIEKAEAVNNLEKIIPETDAVMVARGDLAIETKLELVPLIQQKIVRLSRQNKKPVIVATQMLESMIENPRPTRAEVSDVANAVLDQVDAVMLSAESASGKYPVEAVLTMQHVINSIEENLDYKHYIKINWEQVSEEELPFNAIASSAASLAYRIGAKVIVSATATGNSAKRLSSFRPGSDIVAVTHDLTTSNQLALVWNVNPLIVKPSKDSDTFWRNITAALKENKFVEKKDKAVLVGGSIVGVSGATDTIKVVTI